MHDPPHARTIVSPAQRLLPAALAVLLHATPALAADGATALDAVQVRDRRLDLVGEAISASEGVVGAADIAQRPLLRSGDLMEFVPGMVATQHSGSGKANQYFLRGFNLDHGTDFATFVDGMPANMRSHGHGQGYTDLNFLIPETVQSLSYRKGSYYADVGDFSAAGSAQFHIADRLDQGVATLSAGGEGYRRLLLADSLAAAGGELLLAGEAEHYDGPWSDVGEDERKRNLLLRWSREAGGGRAHLMFMGYRNRWNSADQIPQRAVADGTLSRLGSIDPDLGGESSRYSLSGGWEGEAWGGWLRASAYSIDYDFRLWSNFTYWLDDADDGDEFEQVDQRRIHGFDVAQQWRHGRSQWQLGVQGRYDDIGKVGLYHTRERRVLSAVREDRVREASLGAYAAHEYQWTPTLRSYLGLRHDDYHFDVDALQPQNSGSDGAGKTSAKASLVWRAAAPLELYLGWGQGFHSNDARGVTLKVDPSSGEPASRVDALVGSHGAELGARLYWDERFNATLALWTLHLDSELLFVGDAGTTEASRPSERRGAELGLYWFPGPRVSTSLELSWTHAHFSDDDPAGDRIPGAVPFVANLGLHVEPAPAWSLDARLRHTGRYPLVEDGSMRSAGATVLNLALGRQWRRFGVRLELLNALDSDDHDIDYYYASRLPGESADGVEDIHFHPMTPRTLRTSVSWNF